MARMVGECRILRMLKRRRSLTGRWRSGGSSGFVGRPFLIAGVWFMERIRLVGWRV